MIQLKGNFQHPCRAADIYSPQVLHIPEESDASGTEPLDRCGEPWKGDGDGYLVVGKQRTVNNHADPNLVCLQSLFTNSTDFPFDLIIHAEPP
jgi:hypothetical protein